MDGKNKSAHCRNKWGTDQGQESGSGAFRSRKGFDFGVREAIVRPSNMPIGDLLGNDIVTEAVLNFLRDTKIEIAKGMNT